MNYIVRQSIFLLLLLLLVSSHVSAHIPHLRRLRRPFKNNLEKFDVSDGLSTFYYKQPLDHFNYQPQSDVMFDQRYIINFKYWKGVNPNTPIFAYFGAEENLDNDIYSIGFPLNFTSRYKAMLVYLEHRFYGQSIPFGSLKKAMGNATIRGYLNSAQALADYAQVLLHVKKIFAAETSPIIVIGGSYVLAAWFRLKYPHITLGALASSAPILYFDNITPQDEYYSIVSKSFRETSESCCKTIRRSWVEIDRIAKETPQGLLILSKRFKTCRKLNRSLELKGYLDSMFTEAAQYNFPSDNPVDAICMAIDGAAKKKTIDLIGQVFAGLIAYMGERSCYNVYEYETDSTDPYSWQRCSELVRPIGCSGKDKSMFPAAPFNLNIFKNDCKALYGVSPRPHWITTFYGGHDLKLVLHRFASNIIFSNGLKDPYSSGGVLHNISQSIVAITTVKGAHCLDIQNAEVDDPDWLKMQRKAEMDIIDDWISKYYADVLLFKKNVGAH